MASVGIQRWGLETRPDRIQFSRIRASAADAAISAQIYATMMQQTVALVPLNHDGDSTQVFTPGALGGSVTLPSSGHSRDS